MPTTAFLNSSKRIAQDFLNSVVAVDDNLFFERTSADALDNSDDGFDDAIEDDSGLGQMANSVNSPEQSLSIPGNHPLDYQELSLSFSEFGINCCAFRPDIERFGSITAAAEQIMKSAKRADITILDWSMDHKYGFPAGTLAKNSIERILQDDRELNGRLRLIIIYTGEPILQEIAQEVHDSIVSIDNAALIQDRTICFQKRDLEFCRITVIDKKDNADELRDEAISLFTDLTAGLLSNATLSAIGELRDKTHHILHTFNKQLDPAYLAHVIGLLSSPQVREKSYEIAFDYATDLISEEIKSNLQISGHIKENLCLDRLHDWVEYTNSGQQADYYEIGIGNAQPTGVGSARIKDLLNYVSEAQLVTTLSSSPQIVRGGTSTKILETFSKQKIHLKLKGNGYLSHEALSAVECKRRDLMSLRAGTPLPTVKQGTIVKKDDTYYICMQPLCDSVRIEHCTNFIFLRISVVEDGKNFTHVLKNSQGDFIKFNIKPGSKDIYIFNLKPDTVTNTVKAVNDGDDYKIIYKINDAQEDSLIWFGELKANVAQAIANKLAEQISRVGLDTNEWLRRH
ncbi:TPA: response regulator receiver domain [Salmonella enterica subsp. enterica serovar 1,4,[5],12:b:-]|nr:response regulator receiver domain [Citrobacter youngae]